MLAEIMNIFVKGSLKFGRFGKKYEYFCYKSSTFSYVRWQFTTQVNIINTYQRFVEVVPVLCENPHLLHHFCNAYKLTW
jgi:hypothetical protein